MQKRWNVCLWSRKCNSLQPLPLSIGFEVKYCEIECEWTKRSLIHFAHKDDRLRLSRILLVMVGHYFNPSSRSPFDGYPCRERVQNDGQTYFRCTSCPATSWGALCNRCKCAYISNLCSLSVSLDIEIGQYQSESDRLKDPWMHEQGKYFQCEEAGPYWCKYFCLNC